MCMCYSPVWDSLEKDKKSVKFFLEGKESPFVDYIEGNFNEKIQKRTEVGVYAFITTGSYFVHWNGACTNYNVTYKLQD